MLNYWRSEFKLGSKGLSEYLRVNERCECQNGEENLSISRCMGEGSPHRKLHAAFRKGFVFLEQYSGKNEGENAQQI